VSIMHASVAINASGIADAFRLCQISDPDGAARVEWLTDHFEGWIGVMMRIAEAGEAMERFRTNLGAAARWGCELPDLYEVWDAIAQGLWDKLGATPVEQIVGHAIDCVVLEDR
jgi:hypothetical protein